MINAGEIIRTRGQLLLRDNTARVIDCLQPVVCVVSSLGCNPLVM